jgi:hypothetical protein
MAQKSRTDLKASTDGTVQWLIDLMTKIADSQTNVVDDGIGGASDGSSSVREYVALITQSGTDAPTAKVLKNTLGGVPTLNRAAAGIYYMELNEAFNVDKTCVFIGNTQNDTGTMTEASCNSTSRIYIETILASNAFSDDLMTNCAIQILVYP